MNHQDAEITEIVVVVRETYCDKIHEAVALLTASGVEILSTDEDEGVIGGTIETYKLPDLEKIDCVNYVRTVLTYIADYPTGDPRDQDGDDEGSEAI